MKTKTKIKKPAHSSNRSIAHVSGPFFQKKSQIAAISSSIPQGVSTNPVLKRSGDKYEKEADTVADGVTGRNSAELGINRADLYSNISPLVQRQSEDENETTQLQAEEENEGIQLQAEDENEVAIQGKTDNDDERVLARKEQDKELNKQVQTGEREEIVQAQTDEETEEPEEVQTKNEEEDSVQPLTEEEEPLQTKSEVSTNPASTISIRKQLRVLRGGGSVLPRGVRSKMEQRFGADFSGIRIHTDRQAAQLNRFMNARAFTHGANIYFNESRFSPTTKDGQHLLAHELTHTIQQGAAVPLVDAGAKAETQPVAESEEIPTVADEIAEAPEKPATESVEKEVSPTPETPSAEVVDVPVELPEPPATPESEEIAVVEEIAFEGSSDAAMVEFIEADPSRMAKAQPTLGNELTSKIDSEVQQEVENAPVLVAKTSGTLEEGLTPPDQIPVPADAELKDGVSGKDPEKLNVDPHRNLTDKPSNKESEKMIDSQEEGGFLNWLRNNMHSFLDRIRTKDRGLNTNAGKRPNVQLEGQADPERMSNQRAEAAGQLKTQRDTTTRMFKNHPGQKNIKPKEIHEDKTAKPSAESFVTIDTVQDPGATEYANAALPADVRSRSDELLKPVLTGNLSEAKSKTEAAGVKRDQDKAAEIKKAQSDTTRINQQADNDQRDIVVKNRQQVANQQKTGIEEAYSKVNEFNEEADNEQTAAQKEIGAKVKDSEERAGKELEKGEADAEKKRIEGEKEAEAEKQRLKTEQKKSSWWDRAVNAIKSAIKAITKAIDFIFTKIRNAVKTIIEKAKQAAIGLINAARDWVVDKLNKFRNWAKGMVNKYLKDHFPVLAMRINRAIDTVVDSAIEGVNYVADTAIAGIEALASALSAALDKVLQVFQTALKAAVQIAGAVITGDFAEALRIAIQAACDIAGIDSKRIFDFIDRAAAQVMNILRHPKSFFNNLMTAVGGGVRNFVNNIKKHLIGGLIGWLTGALSEVAITLPEKFDVKGIFSLVMQILGLTYDNIKAKVIKRFPPAEKVFSVIEKGFDIVRKLVTEGPIALWEQVKQSLSNLKEMVLSGIRDFVITTVVKEAITWLLGLLNPAGAIVKIVKLLYDFVMFLVERFQQIKDFVLSVYNSIAAIAAGALTKATQAVEDALSRSLPVVISLLASLAGLRGIGKTVKKIIGKVSKPVQKVVDRLILKIVKFAKKLLKKAKTKAKALAKGFVRWTQFKKTFKSKDNKTHHLYFKGKTQKVLMIKSEEQTVERLLKNVQAKTTEEKSALKRAKGRFKEIFKLSDNLINKDKAYQAHEKQGKQNTSKAKELKSEMTKITEQMYPIFDSLQKDIQILGVSGEISATIESNLQLNTDRKIAKPLTALPGKIRGNKYARKVQPEGYANLLLLDQENKDRERAAAAKKGVAFNEDSVKLESHQFVRMHMIHHRLHGPATSDNIYGAPIGTNTDVADKVELPLIRKVYQLGKIMQYEVDVDLHSGTYSGFAKKIVFKYKPMGFDKKSKKPIELSGPEKKKEYADLRAPREVRSSSPIEIILSGSNIGEPNLRYLSFPSLSARRIAAAMKANPGVRALKAMQKFYDGINEVPKGRKLTAKTLKDDLKVLTNKKVSWKKNNVILRDS
jgi:phage-related protein